jgi:hypothetical protein
MVVRGMKTFEGGWAILVRCPVEEVRKLESDGEGGRMRMGMRIEGGLGKVGLLCCFASGHLLH